MHVFFGEKILLGIKLPESIKILNNNTFIEQNINSFIIPHCLINEIGDNAFSECFLIENIFIPKGVSKIGKSAFSGCNNLKNIFIPDSVNSIGRYAFAFCDSLSEIFLSNTNISYGLHVFFCSPTKIKTSSSFLNFILKNQLH